eukprot:gene5612-7752_t
MSSTVSSNREIECLSKKKYPKGRILYGLWNVVILKLLVIITCFLPIESLSNCLSSGQSLYVGNYLLSANGLVTLLFQSDGNICIYYASSGAPSGGSIWCSDYFSSSPYILTMQSDGNLVAYDTSGSAFFASNTYGYFGGSFAIIQSDQNFVVYTYYYSPTYACSSQSPSCPYTSSGDSNTCYDLTPTAAPVGTPTSNPSSIAPSSFPTKKPSIMPSPFASSNPTKVPSQNPTPNPSIIPSVIPTSIPSTEPSALPSLNPTVNPTPFPSGDPTSTPTNNPTERPSSLPTPTPSNDPTPSPSCIPSSTPTADPSERPSFVPTATPSNHPTSSPSHIPSSSPTSNPTRIPSSLPTINPSQIPSFIPTAIPSNDPTESPSHIPSSIPTEKPTETPSSPPTSFPTSRPTSIPSLPLPSSSPTVSKPSLSPSIHPSKHPTNTQIQVTFNLSQLISGVSMQQIISNSTIIYEAMRYALVRDADSSISINILEYSESATTHKPSEYPSSQPSKTPIALTLQPTEFPSCLPTAPQTTQTAVPSRNPISSQSPSIFPSSVLTNFPSIMSTTSLNPSSIPTKSPTLIPSSIPSTNPINNPATSPTSSPSLISSSVPSCDPTCNPTARPTLSPSLVLSSVPSSNPTNNPAAFPTASPSNVPSLVPRSKPSFNPATRPTSFPSLVSSSDPTLNPTIPPTSYPSLILTFTPSSIPASSPINNPTAGPTSFPFIVFSYIPSSDPTQNPTTRPTSNPSIVPSCVPSCDPTQNPTARPTSLPSVVPATDPSPNPTSYLSAIPTSSPSIVPSCVPSCDPTHNPTIPPTSSSSFLSSSNPTNNPTSTSYPSLILTFAPSSIPGSSPANYPTAGPSSFPSPVPSSYPSCHPTQSPTAGPTSLPSIVPSCVPSCDPTQSPTTRPTSLPSIVPSCVPSCDPTQSPTTRPTSLPSIVPSCVPSCDPTHSPTTRPTSLPSIVPSCVPSCDPTRNPTTRPTSLPSIVPSCVPSCDPTRNPTAGPTSLPSIVPSCVPSCDPTQSPTAGPTSLPSIVPSCVPSCDPTQNPTAGPTSLPSIVPSCVPSCDPTQSPTAGPTSLPSIVPSCVPSCDPTQNPTAGPTSNPSIVPSYVPSCDPTQNPTTRPTSNPSIVPSCVPSCDPTQNPTTRPTSLPSIVPSCVPIPSLCPTLVPFEQLNISSSRPSNSVIDLNSPTFNPSIEPSASSSNPPSSCPTIAPPTLTPSRHPTVSPSSNELNSDPTNEPTCDPTQNINDVPSQTPSFILTSLLPSIIQTSNIPSVDPSHNPSLQPTISPSIIPSNIPSVGPSHNPSMLPTISPSIIPSNIPSVDPSHNPSMSLTISPSNIPSVDSSNNPSMLPTISPSIIPSNIPSVDPSYNPIMLPTISPSIIPSNIPSVDPTSYLINSHIPSYAPSSGTTFLSSNHPSSIVSLTPSNNPSATPSLESSRFPSSLLPSYLPTYFLTNNPTPLSTGFPTSLPSYSPPTYKPSRRPSARPSVIPSKTPTFKPSTYAPSAGSSCSPSTCPSSTNPSSSPTLSPTLTVMFDVTFLMSDLYFSSPNYAVSNITNNYRTYVKSENLTSYVVQSAAKKKIFQLYTIYFLTETIEFGNYTTVSFASTSSPSCSPTSIPSGIIGTAPEIALLSTDLSKNSILVNITFDTLTLEYSGTVYCAALSNGTSVTSVSQIVVDGYSASFVAKASNIDVTISSLTALTEYNLYCYVQTTEGYASSLATVLKTKFTTTTTCCKSIDWENAPSSLYGDVSKYSSSQSSSYIFSYSLSAGPISTVTITPIITYRSNGSTVSSSIIKPSPSSSTFLSTSTVLTKSFILIASGSLSGDFKIKLNATGTNANQYTTSSASVKIVSSASAKPAPILSYSRFSDNGASFYIYFDSATNSGSITSSSWSCSHLFNFTASNLTTCSWINTTVARGVFPAYDGTVAFLEVGQNVTVFGNIVKAYCDSGSDCSNYNYTEEQSVLTLAPTSPISPAPVLVLATLVGPCDNVSIDASLSTGSGGRFWSSVTWTVSGGSSSLIETHLTSYGVSISSGALNIPKQYLEETSYTISLSLTNFLGENGVSSASFKVGSNPNIPILKISGSSSISMKANAKLQIYTSASFSSCANTSSSISYGWGIFLDGIKQNINSTSKNPSIFLLSKYSLMAGNVYTVKVNATIPATTLYSSATSTAVTTVTVKNGVITASISGGSVKQSPVNKITTFDASGSSDEDVSTTSDLHYEWYCTFLTSSKFGESCDSDLSGTTTNQSSLSIPANALSESYSYTIQVVVYSSDYTRYGSTSVILSPTAAGTATTSTSISATKFNVGKQLQVSGNLQSSYDINANWKAYVSSSEVSITTLTSQSVNLTSSLLTSAFSFPLLVSADVFTAGSVITFRLTAVPTSSSSFQSSYSEISITANSPPSGGSFSVSPSSGDALSTSFSFSMSGWSTDSLPLTYDFNYYVLSGDAYLSIQTRSPLTSATSTLPSGSQSYSYEITIIARVYDSYLSYSSSTSYATCQLSASTEVSSVLSTSLTTSFLSGSIDKVLQTINSVASTVSSVNCTLANSTYCASLNRDKCSSTINTCSSCLSGYKGISGDSNSKCLDENSSSGETGSSCSNDDDCVLNNCSDGVCAAATKQCPSSTTSECSDHGSCSYRDSSGNSLTSDECVVSNVFCSVSCSCDDGYGGSDCSLTSSDLSTLDAARGSMCSALIKSYAYSDESSSLLDSFVASLLSIYSPNEVTSNSSIALCTSALNTVNLLVENGYLADAQTSTKTYFAKTLSKFVTTPNGSYNSTVNTVANSLISGVFDSMVEGQSATEIVSDNIRIAVHRDLLSSLSNSSISPPQTTDELAYGAVSPKMEFGGSADACGGSSGYVELSILQWGTNPYPGSVEAPVLGLSQPSNTSSSSRRNLIQTKTVDLSSDPSYFISLQFSSVQDFNFSVDLTSPASNFTLPACQLFNGSQFVSCGACNISSYTNYNVTFGCYDISQICPTTARRRLSNGYDEMSQNNDNFHRYLSDSSSSTGSQFSAIFSAIAAEIASVLSTNPFAVNLGKSKVVVSFVGSLIFAIFFGSFYFSRWDKLDHHRYLYGEAKEKKLAVASRRNKNIVSAAESMHSLIESRSKSSDYIASNNDNIGSVSNPKVPVNSYSINPIFEFLRMAIPPSAIKAPKYTIDLLMDAVLHRHSMTCMFISSSLKNTRFMRWLKLCQLYLIGLFIDTLFYGIYYPNNGLCESLTTQTDCETPVNQATASPMCTWSSSSGCSLGSPPNTISFYMISTLMIVIIGTPIDAILSFISEEYASKIPDLEEFEWSTEFWFGRSTQSINKTNIFVDNTAATMAHLAHKLKSNHSLISNKLNDKANPHVDASIDDYDIMQDEMERAPKHEEMKLEDINFISIKTFDDLLSPEQELHSILTKVRAYLRHQTEVSPLLWRNNDNNHAMVDQRAKINAITSGLNLLPNGIPMQLSLKDYILYGNYMNKMEKTIEKTHKIVKRIIDQLESFEEEDRSSKDIALLQFFILENFSLFKKYVLKQQLFTFDFVSPERINPHVWLLAWIILIGSYSFFVYWMFAWGVSSGSSVVTAWGLNFGIGIIQDIFFCQIFKIFMLYVIAMGTIRPQLVAICRVLNDIALNRFSENDENDDVHNNKSATNDLTIIQHLSPTCRAARLNITKELISAKILRKLNDIDIEKCKQNRSIRLQLLAALFLTIPILFSTLNESVGDVVTDIIIPGLFTGIVFINSYLFTYAGLVGVIIVNFFFIMYCLWKLGFFRRKYGSIDLYNYFSKWKIRNNNRRKYSNAYWLNVWLMQLAHSMVDCYKRLYESINKLSNNKSNILQSNNHINHVHVWQGMNMPMFLQPNILIEAILYNNNTHNAHYDNHHTSDNKYGNYTSKSSHLSSSSFLMNDHFHRQNDAMLRSQDSYASDYYRMSGSRMMSASGSSKKSRVSGKENRVLRNLSSISSAGLSYFREINITDNNNFNNSNNNSRKSEIKLSYIKNILYNNQNENENNASEYNNDNDNLPMGTQVIENNNNNNINFDYDNNNTVSRSIPVAIRDMMINRNNNYDNEKDNNYNNIINNNLIEDDNNDNNDNNNENNYNNNHRKHDFIEEFLNYHLLNARPVNESQVLAAENNRTSKRMKLNRNNNNNNQAKAFKEKYQHIFILTDINDACSKLLEFYLDQHLYDHIGQDINNRFMNKKSAFEQKRMTSNQMILNGFNNRIPVHELIDLVNKLLDVYHPFGYELMDEERAEFCEMMINNNSNNTNDIDNMKYDHKDSSSPEEETNSSIPFRDICDRIRLLSQRYFQIYIPITYNNSYHTNYNNYYSNTSQTISHYNSYDANGYNEKSRETSRAMSHMMKSADSDWADLYKSKSYHSREFELDQPIINNMNSNMSKSRGDEEDVDDILMLPSLRMPSYSSANDLSRSDSSSHVRMMPSGMSKNNNNLSQRILYNDKLSPNIKNPLSVRKSLKLKRDSGHLQHSNNDIYNDNNNDNNNNNQSPVSAIAGIQNDIEREDFNPPVDTTGTALDTILSAFTIFSFPLFSNQTTQNDDNNNVNYDDANVNVTVTPPQINRDHSLSWGVVHPNQPSDDNDDNNINPTIPTTTK